MANESHTIPWKQFKEQIADEKNVVIDVRTPAEIEGGKLFPDALEIDFYDPQFENKISELDPSKTYYIYCRSGGRSDMALSTFRKYNLDTYHLRGGYNAAHE